MLSGAYNMHSLFNQKEQWSTEIVPIITICYDVMYRSPQDLHSSLQSTFLDGQHIDDHSSILHVFNVVIAQAIKWYYFLCVPFGAGNWTSEDIIRYESLWS